MGIRLRESCVTISNKAGAGISDSPWAGSVLPSPPYSLDLGLVSIFSLLWSLLQLTLLRAWRCCFTVKSQRAVFFHVSRWDEAGGFGEPVVASGIIDDTGEVGRGETGFQGR